jgi:6-phosphogluconate dehydrogenase (decarboxylating)
MRIGLLGNHTGWAPRLAAAGFEVVTYGAYLGEAAAIGVIVDRLGDFVDELEHPRRFMLDIPPGGAVDSVVDESYVVMEPGDVVIDPTPSYWGDTLRRYRRMRHRSVYYVDVSMMGESQTALASGDERAVALALPVLARLVPPGGVVCAGGAGAAHFALMVRAGVATAVAHALSEARQLVEAYPNGADPESVMGRLWPTPHPASPAAAWLLEDAVRLHAAIPLLAQAVMLEMGAALDDHRSVEVPPRVGGFVHPDDIL